jgi:NhaP-type Na+/H+ or K+/H+ antiporter
VLFLLPALLPGSRILLFLNLDGRKRLCLGAIISPPDAVAAAAATKGLKIPKRVTTILEGESLVNDATGLIAYRFALAAVITGSFSIWEASYKFVIVAIGGIILGFIMGYLFKWIHKLTPDNPTTDTVLTFHHSLYRLSFCGKYSYLRRACPCHLRTLSQLEFIRDL